MPKIKFTDVEVEITEGALNDAGYYKSDFDYASELRKRSKETHDAKAAIGMIVTCLKIRNKEDYLIEMAEKFI